MDAYKEKVNKAIKEVTDKLLNLSQEDFEKELDKHKDSDRTKSLYYAFNPLYCGESNEL